MMKLLETFMKTSFLFYGVVSLHFMINPVQSFGLNPDSVLTIVPHWGKGDIKKYNIIYKTKTPYFQTTVISAISQKITDIVGKNITLELQYDTIKQLVTSTEGFKQSQGPLLQQLLSGKIIKYRTDLCGRITEVLNLNELTQQIKPRYDSLVPSFRGSRDPQKFANFLLKDVLAIHQIYGRALNPSDSTVLNLKYSIAPDIQIEQGSIIVKYKQNVTPESIIMNDRLVMDGQYLNLVSPIVSYSVHFEFRISSGDLLGCTVLIESKIHDNSIIEEYEIILLP